MKEYDFEKLKEDMISTQIVKRGITDERIIDALRNVPRHLFVPHNKLEYAYQDSPLPIGCGQTISQPYIVALMTELVDVKPGMRILEIGTGSGYQSAILCYLGGEVYTIERIQSLAKRAQEIFSSLGYRIKVKVGDGTLGWQEYAPYDRIIVTAATPQISPYWRNQLKIGGKIIVPLGGPFHQDLTVIEKFPEEKFEEKRICGCIFVPLIGEYGYKE
jgi:protein-L-isoaspartate(D-aspartate) O-methyltransferase